MMYMVEKVAVIPSWNRRGNPITAQMRTLEIGESFIVKHDDPNWTGSQVKNENQKGERKYATRKETGGLRIGRIA